MNPNLRTDAVVPDMNPITLLLSPWCWSWLLRHQRDIDIVKQRLLQTECSSQSQILSGVGRYSNLPCKMWGSNNNMMQQKQTSFITQFWHRTEGCKASLLQYCWSLCFPGRERKEMHLLLFEWVLECTSKTKLPFLFQRKIAGTASAVSTGQVAFL